MSDEQLINRLRDSRYLSQHHSFENVAALCEEAADRIKQLTAERDAALAEVERLREALNPSPITKQAYSAEFTFTTPHGSVVFVPWTTVKEIMSAIKEHAGIKEQP